LGDAVHLNQLLDVAFVAGFVAIVAITLLLVICHNLELQPAFTSSIGQRLHATVVLEARTVERHLGDASGLGTLGYQLTNLLGRLDVAGGSVAQFFVQGRGGSQDLATVRRDDLGVDVLGGAIHTQAYHFQLAHFQACLASATQTRFFLFAHLLCPTSSWLLCEGRLHPHSARPCPCTAPDGGSREFQRPLVQALACRCPSARCRSGWGSRPRRLPAVRSRSGARSPARGSAPCPWPARGNRHQRAAACARSPG